MTKLIIQNHWAGVQSMDYVEIRWFFYSVTKEHKSTSSGNHKRAGVDVLARCGTDHVGKF
jgi:hypothetical protein